MKPNQPKPGMTTKPTPGAKVTPGSTGTSNKGPDPKHLPREFKYFNHNKGINSYANFRYVRIHLTSMMKQNK